MSDEESLCVRVRGLPWSTSPEELVTFFSDCNVANGADGVNFTFTRDGRPSGEAYVELASLEDRDIALKHNNQHMGRRYIEVFTCKSSEMEYVLKRSGPGQVADLSEAVLRLRGLPFGCTKEEIANFFTGYEMLPGGITLVNDNQGRTSGDAFVQFASPEIAESATGKHKERIGHRYIEIFKSTMSECKAAEASGGFGRGAPMGGAPSRGNVRSSPYERQERGGYGGGGYGGGRGGGGGGRGRNVKGLFDTDPYQSSSGGYGDYSSNGAGRGRGRGGMGGDEDPMSTYVSSTGHAVHMRGLPFQCVEQDIADFFSHLSPARIVIHYQSNGRATGEADVDFSSHEGACEAMKKQKANIQHRYIDLFLNSSAGGSGGGGGGMGGMSGMGAGAGIHSTVAAAAMGRMSQMGMNQWGGEVMSKKYGGGGGGYGQGGGAGGYMGGYSDQHGYY